MIGFTENGDPSFDNSWTAKIPLTDGIVVVTKNLTKRLMNDLLNNKDHVILHCSCTGWGTSVIEPNAPHYTTQLDNLKQLIDLGFPRNRTVLRIDPIIPTPNGLCAVRYVLDYAIKTGIILTTNNDIRIRISVMDEYKHVKARLAKLGYGPFYDNSFYAPRYMLNSVVKLCSEYHDKYGLVFETCAETLLSSMNKSVFKCTGCLSKTDLDILGVPVTTDRENNQHRSGCHCLADKTEVLSNNPNGNKHRCPMQCVYCYWKD